MPYKPSIPVSAGQTFHRWTLVKITHSDEQGKYWLCRCECGTERAVRQNRLVAGKSKSCGCLQREINIATHTTHGRARTPEYQIFRAMHDRCDNPNNRNYKNYGGRGITVCDRWGTFENFFADMGERPSPELTIERKNNNGNYSPDNCLWATDFAQDRNKRNNHFYAYDGQSKILPDWANEYAIPLDRLRARLGNDWSMDDALNLPLHSSPRPRNIGNAPRGEQNHAAKLTEKEVQEIRVLIKANVPLRKIAPMFNVNWSAIGAIKYKRTWKHLPE